MLLPRGSGDEAQTVAAGLQETIRGLTAPGGRAVAASIGVALFSEAEASTEEMLVRADLAMYDAKQGGRDRIAFYTEEAGEGRAIDVGRLQEIEQAITGGRLTLYAQPIVELASGNVAHHELLVRMPGPQGEIVSASEFIPVAERYGLVGSIDRWVLGQALTMLREGRTGGTGLTVNVSAKSLEEDTVGWMERNIAESPEVASKLIIELTETAAIASLRAGRRFAQRLRALGVALALDDFGVGFGSFTYLRRIPFDVLKIDGQFVKDCADDEKDRALVEGLARIASSLGKRTVAEYVGDDRTVEVLRDLGVDMGQGFHLGRPVPVEDAF